MTEFGIAELCSSPIVNLAQKREVTSWSSSMSSILFRPASISSSVDGPKWSASLFAPGPGVGWDTRLSPTDSWEDILLLQQQQLETTIEDNCVVRESKPSGEYIINFNWPKYVSCKKTESGRHTRCPRGRGVGRALHPHGALVSFPDCFLFFYFPKYSKTKKYCH